MRMVRIQSTHNTLDCMTVEESEALATLEGLGVLVVAPSTSYGSTIFLF